MAQARGASAGSSRRAPAQTQSTSPMIGAVLVIVAALIGIMLLAKGGGGVEASGSAQQPGIAGQIPDQGKSPASTDPQTVITTPPSQLKIIVANGSNVKGVARKGKDQLATAGYSLTVPVDASATVQASIVYFVAGADADARAIARTLGLPEESIGLMPTSPPIKQQLGDAKILVVLSTDSPQAGGVPVAPNTTAAP